MRSLLCAAALWAALASIAGAAQPSQLATPEPWAARAADFLMLRDTAVRWPAAGSVLLGVGCGIMGCFLLVRKFAMLGDALSHAVLPGVAAGFLASQGRHPGAIFLGALAAALLGAATVHALRAGGRHREDAALGYVLAAFFGTGVCLLTMIQNTPGLHAAGLESFLFGQAATLGPCETAWLLATALAAAAVSILFFRELKVACFDEVFARAAGLPVRFIHGLLMMLLAGAIVTALQAVGVVLVSAMLVLPAAAAFLLCVRMGPMLALAAGIGGACGLGGALASYLGGQLPTGPLMVLCASGAVLLAWLFSPQNGLLARMWRQARLSRRIREENILRALYLELESKAADWEGAAAISEIAQRLRQPSRETAPHIHKLKKAGLATGQGLSAIRLTPKGLARARDIVRRHRLWELYLATAANFPPDHVHEDAEKIEHLLGEETLRRLDQRLPEALRDPHGKAIPGPRTHPPPRP